MYHLAKDSPLRRAHTTPDCLGSSLSARVASAPPQLSQQPPDVTHKPAGPAGLAGQSLQQQVSSHQYSRHFDGHPGSAWLSRCKGDASNISQQILTTEPPDH